MSVVNGFQVGAETLKYNYESLENYNTPEFSSSSSKAYAIGDYVMHNGKLYKCTTATTGGTWVSGSWELAILSDDLQSIDGEVDGLKNDVDELVDDVDDLSENVTQLSNAIDTKAPVIINSVSGDIATFADGADDMPIKHLVADIEAVQSGTGDPSPSNIRPITGWTGLTGARTGKNLLNIPNKTDTVNGVTLTILDGVIIANGTATSSINYHLQDNMSLPENEYIFSVNDAMPTGTALAVQTSAGNKEVSVIGTEFNGSLDGFCWLYISTNTTLNNVVIKPMLRPATHNDNTFEPYQGDTISVSWQSEAGTVYGGTLDVVMGVLTVNSAKIVFDGTQQVGLSNWQTNQDSAGWLYTPSITPGIQNDVLINSNLDLIIADKLKTVIYGGSEGIYGNAIPSISIAGTSAWGVAMRVNDPTLTNNNAINAYLSSNPVTVIYKLATPIVYQLDPVTVNTLLGNNTVYVDCGSVTVDYPTDTGIVIAQQSNAISQLEGQVVTDVTVSGTIVTITAEANKRYLCGTVASIDVTPCVSGAFDLIFTSGSTAAVLTIPSTVKWQDSSFDPTALDADTTYEISVAEGTLGLVASWT